MDRTEVAEQPEKVAPQETEPGLKAQRTTELKVAGMSCSNCARHVTEAIQGVPGVSNVLVTLEPGRAVVRWSDPRRKDIPAVLQSVEAAGYKAQVLEPGRPGAQPEERRASWHLNLWVGVLGTVPLMLGEWVLGLAMAEWFRWVSFVLASIVQAWAGGPFYRGAWNQLKAGSSNMDTLVALGSTTAYAFSVWAFFSGSGGHLYFMEAAAIITLISVGHWIEARASARASTALQKLLHLTPALARRREADGSEREVPVAELAVNDHVVLKPGDRVPTDGQVGEGQSAVDESMLTGESVPVNKSPQDLLCAGTVNLNGRIIMRVTATGEETALAHIIAAVQRAQTSRANIQRLGDRVSAVFVPIVVAIAAAAALWWGLAPQQAQAVHQWLAQFLGDWWPVHVPADPLTAAVITAAAVLIVACPCAMGLATPAAIMAGSNAAARRGILIRDGVALEKAGQVTTVVFDKTGTLTFGKPEVAKYELMGRALPLDAPSFPSPHQMGRGLGEGSFSTQALQLAASLARRSNHPLSQAVAKLDPADVDLEDWQEVHGAGVQARSAENPVRLARLGSLKWLEESKVDASPAQAFAAEWADRGATILGLALDGALFAVFALQDQIKPGARQVVEQLQRTGLKVLLVTGDNQRTAASIGQQAGISPENIFAEVRPEHKAGLVKKFQERGERVAFIGDGINDAPALEQADLGIAVSRASDIAREAADIILLNSEIEAVPESLGLARATLRTIKQNLFWAFFYNALFVPLAAVGLMSPVLCAAAMGFSDLIVIGNAIRLSRFRMRSGSREKL